MARDLETVIRISGNLDASLRRVIEQAAENIERLQEAARQSAGAVDAMSDTINNQSADLKRAQKAYANYILKGEEGSEQAQQLAEEIQRLSKDLKSNRSALQAAERAAQQLADGYDDAEEAARRSVQAVDSLSDTIGEQSDELKQAKKQYAAYVLSGQKSSDQAKALARRIGDLSQELSDNRTRMRGAEDAADRLAGRLDDVGDAARDTKGGFTVMKGAAANLVSAGVQLIISKCVEAASAIYGLADSTREFRQDMNTLTTAYDQAGFSAEQATDTWTDLYAIFGEDDRAVEAANNISRIADSQKELDQWTRITTGIWGTYQDALAVEGLAEAASETINTGTVTGALADALNWSSDAAKMFSKYMSEDVVTAEDAFNVALSKCSTEAERNALVTDTLTKLYGDAADKYNETAASVIEANKATADYTRKVAEMGERIEPVTTAVRSGFNRILDKALELTASVDFDAMADRISAAFDVLTDDVIPKVLELKDSAIDLADNGIGWLKQNADWLVPVLGGLSAGFATYKGIMVAAAAQAKIMTAVEAVKTAVLASGAATVSAATVATWAFNAAVAFLTSPVTIAVAAIAGLVAIGITLYKNWDVIKEKAAQLGTFLSGKWTEIKASAKNAVDGIVGWFTSGFESLVGIVKGPIDKVTGFIDGVKNKLTNLKDSVSGKISGAVDAVKSKIPAFASGGFTNGLSIAGEAGTEAVISFDRAVREENLGYWAKAGQLLGATPEDAGFSLSGTPSSTTVIDMGGVTFAPSISISGKADRESVVKAIQNEYPEFLDMLEDWLIERGVTVYA